MKRLNIVFLALTMLLVSCKAGAERDNTALPTVMHTAVPSDPSPQPLDDNLPKGSIEPTQPPTSLPAPIVSQPTATAVQSPTPPRDLILAVPEHWHDSISAYLIEYNSRAASVRDWAAGVSDDPAASMSAGTADAALIPGGAGFSIVDEPLALTVPFTTEWEETSSQEGQRILASGHPLVKVMKWAEVTPQEKALRVDGFLPCQPEYPFRDLWSIAGSDEIADESRQLAAWLSEKLKPGPMIHAAAVGDIMLDRSLGYAISQGDLGYPFAELMLPLSSADITLGNVESALGDIGEAAAKHYTFRAPPQAADSLQMAGFDVLTLANNHALDYGSEALLQGISLLEGAGIGVVGAGANSRAARRPLIREVNGLKLAFFGYVHVPVEISGFDTKSWEASDDSAGLAWGRPADIAADVAAARDSADIIIVQLHSGIEYGSAPSAPQVEAAHAAIDAGADMVIGHHAHILQGIEFYGDGVIAYGLGNFAFQIIGDPSTAILNIWMDRDGVRQLEIVPAIIQYGGQPRIAFADEASAIRHSVYQSTNLLNAK